MAWIRVPTPADADTPDGLAEAWEEVSGRFGVVSPTMRSMSLNPDAMRGVSRLAEIVTFGGSRLGRRREELLSVVVSQLNHCSYCTESHIRYLRKATGDRALADAVRENWRAVDLDDPTRTLLEFAVKLTTTPGQTNKDDVERLRVRGFDDGEILDAVLIVCLFNFMNRLADGLGLTGDEARRRHRYTTGDEDSTGG